MRRFRHSIIVLAAVFSFSAGAASAGISKIFAHGDSFSPGDTIPVFVDSNARTSITVRGQYMDLCTGVESNDSSFVVNIGRRTPGTNSSVEILVGAGNAPDLDAATITIRFVSGQETFRVKAYKINITRMEIMNRTSPTCHSGETISLRIDGAGMDRMALGPIARMMEVADGAEGGHYDLGAYSAGTASARVLIHCKEPGAFNIVRDWFWDPRLRQYTNTPTKMVRSAERVPTRIRVTVTKPVFTKTPVSN